MGSDHYPIFGDYIIVTPPPATPLLSAPAIGTNGFFNFKLTSGTNIVFGVQVSTNLVNWTAIGSGLTDTNGLLQFQDTNRPGSNHRYYRAYWPYP